MPVRVVIERRIKEGKDLEVLALLRELRAKAVFRPGYISGETLTHTEHPSTLVVMSNWQTVSEWKAWESDPERDEVEAKIRALLVEPPRTTILQIV